MASKSILQLTQFTPAGQMLVPVVDPTAGPGLKNGSVLISALLAQLSEAQAGSQIYPGTGAPSAALGNNGDYYIDQSTGYLFGPKSGGVWPTTPIALTSAQDAANAAAIAMETARAEGQEAALSASLTTETTARTSADTTIAAAAAAAQTTANAAMPNTIAALAALFADWVAAEPAQFATAYLVMVNSLPTTAGGAAGTLANINGIVQELQP